MKKEKGQFICITLLLIMMNIKKTGVFKAFLSIIAITMLLNINVTRTLANEEDEIKTGLNVIYEEEYVEPGSIESKEYNFYTSEESNRYWLKFSSNYFYNGLTEQEKKCWIYFENSLVSIAEGTSDASSVDFNEPIITVTETSLEDAQNNVYDFMLKFKLNHPQFYFVSNELNLKIISTGEGTEIYPSLKIYNGFVDGNARMSATQKFKAQIDKWLEDIGNDTYLMENIEQIAVKKICDNAVYGHGTYDQSAYSLVCEGKTVCAGYSATLNMLLNASGIDCITVTSPDHAWNVARIHGDWYGVDATNVDSGKNGVYRSKFYNKSNKTFSGYGDSWTLDSLWDKIPETQYDFNCKQVNDIDSQYIENDSIVYFIINNNKNIGENKARAILIPSGKMNSVPKELEYDNEKYAVIYRKADSGSITPGWKKDEKGYKYQNADGTYVKSSWLKLDGDWYYFDADGYKTTGWQLVGNEWFYMKPDGVMAKNYWVDDGAYYIADNGRYVKNSWKMIHGLWYYFDANGHKTTGWQKVGNNWYYMDSNGIMTANKWINGTYYVKSNGAMAVSEWVDNGKYYVDANGRYVPGKTQTKEGWRQNGTGYWYQNADGTYPKSSWKKIDGNWYYFNASGYRTTGWQKVGNTWYYMDSNGVMTANKWINGIYYVKSNGAMAVSEWVDNNRYYVGADGKWVKDAKR